MNTIKTIGAARWAQAEAIAHATDCGVAGCDRQMHDQSPAAEWSHRIRSIQHGAFEVDVILDADGTTRAHPYLALDADGLDAAGLRALVRQLTKYAAILTSLSTELEDRA